MKEKNKSEIGKEAKKKGSALEKRVAKWAKMKYDYDRVKINDLARGYAVKRGHEIDVHVEEDKGFLSSGYDVWIECKAVKVNRTHVMKLKGSVDDVKKACDEEIEEWYPDEILIVSSSGFDIDALGLAKSYGFECWKANPKGFERVE